MPEPVTKEYLTRGEVAELIGMSVPWLRKMERLSRGIPRVRCGRSVRYPLAAVRQFMVDRLVPVSNTLQQ